MQTLNGAQYEGHRGEIYVLKLRAQGKSLVTIADTVGVRRQTVANWVRAPRGSRKPEGDGTRRLARGLLDDEAGAHPPAPEREAREDHSRAG